MYNRYIPQSDGTYRRNRVQDPPRRPQPVREPPCPNPPAQSPEPPVKESGKQEPAHKVPACQQGGSIGSFLKNLLPQGLDTGDLVVILLLLLMAGDCEEDKNTAMLTLMLYLFL